MAAHSGRRRNRPGIFAILLSLVVLIAAPAAAAPEQAGDTPRSELRVMQWNICSEYGDCPELDDPVGRIKQVASVVNQHQADVIFMLEACESTVAETLAELGTGWTVAFAPWVQKYPGWSSTRGRWCYQGPEGDVNDGLQGTAILVRGELEETTTYELPSPWKERDWESVRNLLCTRHVGSGVKLCATHFTPNWQGGAERPYLVKQIERTLESIDRDDRVLLSGDLNVSPPSGNPDYQFVDANSFLDPVYDRFVECDQRDGMEEWGKPRTGERTTRNQNNPGRGSKIDYIFAAKRTGVTWQSCDVLESGPHTKYSDHLPVLGIVRL